MNASQIEAQLKARAASRDYERWATSKGATWQQAYRLAPPDVRKGMMARRLEQKAQQRAVRQQQKAGIAERFGSQRSAP